MPRTGLWLRVFAGLLFAVLAPILFLVGAVLASETLLTEADPAGVAAFVVAGAIAWAAILGSVYTRVLHDDLRSFRSLAERGEPSTDPELGAAYRQVAGALEERNRQVASLASSASGVPIDDEPRRVVEALVTAVRSVTGDPTWRSAILGAEDAGLLPAGVYFGADDGLAPNPMSDLERWAAVTLSESHQSVVQARGPWGAFAIADLSVSDRLRGILYAPWEGRPEPSPADLALVSVVAQHAGTALEHSLLYARVRSQTDELNRLAAIQADFLRGVTHDLQTPLTSIGALATELRSDATVPPSAQVDLDTIAHQAERLRRMVSQLLVASRLEAGALRPRIEVFAVRPLLDRTWAALRADRPFELSVAGAPHLAVGDPDRFEQVLWALLDNAVKYSPPGSPIKVIVASNDGRMRITVHDEGIGMDEETRAYAFDQFYRAAGARSLAPDGSGVGLYAAKGLVEAMGGSIGIDSALGRGTAITVLLPAESAEAE